MDFLNEMKERKLVAQITHEDELREHLGMAIRTAYIGFDPTADSLHAGNLAAIMTLMRWQRSGHRVIVLLGGATGLVGDPTGRNDMRQVLAEEVMERNLIKFKEQISKFLDFSTPEKGVIVNNADWFRDIKYLPFLREIGAHFSVNRMITAECFKQRLEKGLSFLEFNYMVLQSYDFLHLYRTERCTLQMGGDDQWSNILYGMELVRRLTKGQAFCLTFPLLAKPDGEKMGKTAGGALWLDPAKTSPYEYFQYWRNVDDNMVEPCLKLMTFLPMDEVTKLSSLKDEKINDAKKILAFEATKITHSEEEAKKARETAESLFGKGGQGGTGGNEPVFHVPSAKLDNGIILLDYLVEQKILPSKSEGRRLIQQGGLFLQEKKVENFDYTLRKNDFDEQKSCLVKKGKKYYYRLIISG